MFKRISRILVLILAIPVFALVGCGKYKKSTGIDLFNGNTDFSVVASATSDKINLEISNVKKPKGYKKGQELDVIMLEPYEYYNGEADTGVNSVDASFEYSSGEKVGTYTVGNANTLSLNRYVGDKKDNVDLLYNKFVLAKKGKLVAGPFMVGRIESARNYEPKVNPKSIKGVGFDGVADFDNVKDLNVSQAFYNITINTFVYPNEKPYVDEQNQIHPEQVVPIDNTQLSSNDAYQYVCDGKTYYFRKGAIDALDELTLFCKNNNMKCGFVLYNQKFLDNDWDTHPYYLVYPGTSYEKEPNIDNTICGCDTSNEIGYSYYKAIMEFLAEHYSSEDGEHGYVNRFVVGNEIDISWEWNPVLDYKTTKPLKTDEYVEEYLRTLRIADQATKKFYGHNMVFTSSCHYWTGIRNEYCAYATKDIYDYLNSKASYEGNFDWGIATHPYAIDLRNHRFLYTEVDNPNITGDFNTTMFITWTNLEVIDLYLSQPQLLINGNLRRVCYTEGGVSSGNQNMKAQNEPIQAAGIAYAFYKASCLKTTDAMIYYLLNDFENDNNFYCGLIRTDKTKKPSYELYKFIDTQYSFEVANKYLPSIYFSKNGLSYTYKNGRIKSYKDIMGVIDSNYNWEVQWDETKIITKQVNEKPEILS